MRKFLCLKFILFTFLLSLFPTMAVAEDISQKQISLDLNQAIKRAFAYNPTLKNDEIELDKKTYLKDRAASYVRYTPVDYSFNPSDTNVLSTYTKAEFAERQQEKKIESDKRQLIIDVKTAYYNVLLKQQLLLQAQKNEYLAQVKFLQAKAKKEQGLITELDLLNASAAVESAKASVKESQTGLDNAYSDLNKLVNLDISARPVLTDTIEFKPEKIDVESKANIAAECSYESWSAEEAAKIADAIKIFEKYYDIGDWNVDQAKNTSNDTKDLIRKQARSLGLGLQYMEKKYDEIKANRKQAEEALRVVKMQQQVGLATKDAVLNAEIAYEKLSMLRWNWPHNTQPN